MSSPRPAWHGCQFYTIRQYAIDIYSSSFISLEHLGLSWIFIVIRHQPQSENFTRVSDEDRKANNSCHVFWDFLYISVLNLNLVSFYLLNVAMDPLLTFNWVILQFIYYVLVVWHLVSQLQSDLLTWSQNVWTSERCFFWFLFDPLIPWQFKSLPPKSNSIWPLWYMSHADFDLQTWKSTFTHYVFIYKNGLINKFNDENNNIKVISVLICLWRNLPFSHKPDSSKSPSPQIIFATYLKWKK